MAPITINPAKTSQKHAPRGWQKRQHKHAEQAIAHGRDGDCQDDIRAQAMMQDIDQIIKQQHHQQTKQERHIDRLVKRQSGQCAGQGQKRKEGLPVRRSQIRDANGHPRDHRHQEKVVPAKIVKQGGHGDRHQQVIARKGASATSHSGKTSSA